MLEPDPTNYELCCPLRAECCLPAVPMQQDAWDRCKVVEQEAMINQLRRPASRLGQHLATTGGPGQI